MSTTESRTRILDGLQRLLDISRDLREALLARDPERIQAVTDRQDDLSRLALPAPGAAEALRDDPDIQTAAEQLRRRQESNRLLASSFLGIYRQAFGAAVPASGDPGVYGRGGRLTVPAAPPLMVRQTG